jgi:hypothetical protein
MDELVRWLTNIRTDLIIRVCIITAVFSLISYAVIRKNAGIDTIPLLFVVFGIVLLISILYDIQRFHVITKPSSEPKTS